MAIVIEENVINKQFDNIAICWKLFIINYGSSDLGLVLLIGIMNHK